MSIFGQRLKDLRLSNNLTMEQLGKKLGLSKSAVNMYERGDREPGFENLEAIADFFNVDIDYLLGKTSVKNRNPITETVNTISNDGVAPLISSNVVSFPVIGDLAAGYDQLAVEDWRGETVEIPTSYLKGHAQEDYVVLSVRGDSMFPAYQDGDKVLILKETCVPRSGAVGAVFYKDEMATLKKVEYGDGFVLLQPINPNFPPTRIEGEDLEHFRIFGVPKLLIREIEE